MKEEKKSKLNSNIDFKRSIYEPTNRSIESNEGMNHQLNIIYYTFSLMLQIIKKKWIL